MLWIVKGHGWYESRSHEFNAPDAMNSSGLWMIWIMLGYDLKALDTMNGSGLWITWMNMGHELKALDAMNNTRLRITQHSRCYE